MDPADGGDGKRRHGVRNTGALGESQPIPAPAAICQAVTVHAGANHEAMEANVMTPRPEVDLPSEADVSDEAIAERALQALFSAAPLQRERIAVRIAQGRVTLSGTVGT